MAQVAAATADFLPEQIARELMVFQEDVPPMSAEEARQAVIDSFGKAPEDIYFGFDAEHPLKSGSIGSVYLAKKPVREGGVELAALAKPGPRPRVHGEAVEAVGVRLHALLGDLGADEHLAAVDLEIGDHRAGVALLTIGPGAPATCQRRRGDEREQEQEQDREGARDHGPATVSRTNGLAKRRDAQRTGSVRPLTDPVACTRARWLGGDALGRRR